ncbi:unnamed protein product [Victoria cruziana]
MRKFEFFFFPCSFPLFCCNFISSSSSSIIFHLHPLGVFRVEGTLDNKESSSSMLHRFRVDGTLPEV